MKLIELETELHEGPHDPHIFKAVFMAGAPGAGKTTVAQQLFGGTGLKSLNVDRFWQLYNKMQRVGDYQQYWDKYQTQNKLFQMGRLGLLIDGTARNPVKMREVKDTLEDLGYETGMVFVNTDLETAMNRAQLRAQSPGPDQGREVDPDFIQDSWKRVQSALGTYQSVFAPRFWIVDNSDGVRPISLQRAQRDTRAWLNSPPQDPRAQEWLRQAREG